MKEKQKKIWALSLALMTVLIAIFIAGCTEEENKIIIGTSADFPPFEYTDETGTIVGFDIEMITSILTEQGYTIEVKDISFDSLIPSLEANNIDVIVAGMSITEERKVRISFSDPYFEADQSVLVKKDSGIIINNETDLENLSVGVQTGTTGDIWVFENLVNTSKTPEEKYNQYETYDLAIADLKVGRIEILVLDKPVAQAYAEDEDLSIVYIIITNEQYGIGVRKTDTELLGKINTGLATLKASNDWNELVKKYFE